MCARAVGKTSGHIFIYIFYTDKCTRYNVHWDTWGNTSLFEALEILSLSICNLNGSLYKVAHTRQENSFQFQRVSKVKKKNKMILIKYMNKKNNARTNDKFYSFFFTMTLWIFFILVQVKNFQRVISSPRIYVHVYVHL